MDEDKSGAPSEERPAQDDESSAAADRTHDCCEEVTKGRTAGSSGIGISADETGFGETGSLPDPAAPPLAR